MTVGWRRRVPLVQQVDGAAEDDFLGVGDAGFADQRAQRHQQRQPPGADFPAQRLGVGAAHPPQRRAQRPGVQRVDPVQAAADADDLPAEMLGQQRVVGLGVAEDDGPGAGRDGPGDLPFDQGGFAGAGLAEDELAGVGDQAGPQPGQRVQADDLARQLVPADRRAHGRGARAGDVGVQAADLGGGGLVFRCGRDVRRRGRRTGSSIPSAGGTGVWRLGCSMSWVAPVLVRHPPGQVGGADAARQRGGPAGGLGVGHPAQPDPGGLGGGLGLGDGARQFGLAGDGDGDVQGDQAHPGAGCLLGGGLPGAGLVVAVPGGLVPAGAAACRWPGTGRR